MNDDFCKKCKIPLLNDEGMMVCTSCGVFKYNFVNSFEDDVNFCTLNVFVKYSRVQHFKETLHEVLGMQTKTIPPSIFDEIYREFKPKKTIEKNIAAMRALLKKKKLNCYIKITNNLLTNLKIISPPPLSETIFESLMMKFKQIEESFNCDNNERKNLLPNNYLLFRFFQELGLQQYWSYIFISKNLKLLEKYDIIYKKLKEN